MQSNISHRHMCVSLHFHHAFQIVAIDSSLHVDPVLLVMSCSSGIRSVWIWCGWGCSFLYQMLLRSVARIGCEVPSNSVFRTLPVQAPILFIIRLHTEPDGCRLLLIILSAYLLRASAFQNVIIHAWGSFVMSHNEFGDRRFQKKN